MSIITLTTDFGASSPYVAQMKGVILSLAPSATIVDITHSIGPQDIFAGALALADAAPWFPPETIHVAVVDPGVGTSRMAIAVRTARYWFLAPDNGLLGGVWLREPAIAKFAIENRTLWMPEVSSTFHGRDIFAPVAAHLSLGVAGETLGPHMLEIRDIDWPTPKVSVDELAGEVIAVDSFGNAITSITEKHFRDWLPPDSPQILCGEKAIDRLVRTYGDARQGERVVLFGSSGRLEIAVVGGNAADELNLRRGEIVTLRRKA
jgi:S-adenosylmethionine hydrolase